MFKKFALNCSLTNPYQGFQCSTKTNHFSNKFTIQPNTLTEDYGSCNAAVGSYRLHFRRLCIRQLLTEIQPRDDSPPERRN